MIGKRLLAALSVVVALVFASGDLYAQSRTAGKKAQPKAILKLGNLTKPDKSCLVPSPRYDGNVKGPGRSGGNKNRWAALEVNYVTAPEWIDELTFTFHVMSRDENKAFHYFTTSVSYLNIAKGEHGACVMLPPSAVARYGTPVAFGVIIECEGEVVGGNSEGLSAGLEWWNKLDDLPKLERHAGLLVDRSKTPFALTYIDEYEAVR